MTETPRIEVPFRKKHPEFGVKFNATAGAVIAKTSAEGHLTVTLTWSRRDVKEV